ncbi:hypothetical protein OAA86_00790 [Rhodospirillales bacterium]|nr:hypothetical protein [Rhodospirillales bacterium]
MTSIMKMFPAATGVGRELFKASMIAVFVLPERGLDVLHTWGQVHALLTQVPADPPPLDLMIYIRETEAG